MDCPIYLINLDRSPQRLEYMSNQLNNLGLSYTRVSAVDGSALDTETLLTYQQESKQSWSHYTTLNAGEIGCALSWQQMWNKIINQSSQAVVALEDDAKLGTKFKELIDALDTSPDSNIIIDLTEKKGFNIIDRKNINGIKLIRYQTPPTGTSAKIYGKEACKQLAQNIAHFKAPVDTLQQMTWLHKIKIWSLEEGCASHSDVLVGGSTINTVKKPIRDKLARELKRPLWRLFINVRNAIG